MGFSSDPIPTTERVLSVTNRRVKTLSLHTVRRRRLLAGTTAAFFAMVSIPKRPKRAQKSESESEFDSEGENGSLNEVSNEESDGSDWYSDEEQTGEENGMSTGEEDDGDEEEQEEEEDGDEEDEGGESEKDNKKDEEMEELEKEYRDLQNSQQNLIQNLKRHKDEDLLKGQTIKSQKALWDKALEIRFLLQKAFSKSNKLPKESLRSLFCESDERVSATFSDLIESSQKTIDSLLQLQEALSENNHSIMAAAEGESQSSLTSCGDFGEVDADKEKEWAQISQMQSRLAAFRNNAVDKWQRKADVHSGAAAKKAKLLAFNQNISNQVATYMRDPSKMIKSMQMRREAIGVFGCVELHVGNTNEEGDVEGDPELLDDSDFYQQLLKEFFETIDPSSSESAFYALKKLQTKKRKVVDRRASKSRKIRYNVHEKIVNFMAPQPVNLLPMAPKLFEDLFGLKSQKPSLTT